MREEAASADFAGDQSASISEQPPADTVASQPANNPVGDVGEWSSERISSEIDSRLKSIGQVAVASAESRHELKVDVDWVGPEFRADPLRPNNAKLVFASDTLEVARLRSPASGAESEVRGPDGFRDLLTDWIEPFVGFKHLAYKFKVFSIDRNGDAVSSQIHAHLSGRTSQVRLEENAVWQTRWKITGGKTELVDVTVQQYEQARTNDGRGFRDATSSQLGGLPAYDQQLRFSLNHWLDRLELGVGIIPTGYQGIAVGDVNGDGLDDLFVSQPGGILTGLPNRLFVQQTGGRMQDVSDLAELDWFAESHGALFLDLDNDDDQDLVIATAAGLAFMENVGGNRFQRRATKLMPEAPPISLAAADYDNDGDLDVYACCYSHRSSSDIIGRPLPYHDANNGGRNALFRNDGRWDFRNVVKRVGLEQNNRRFSFAATWDDFDNDGDQDLYVSNDYGRNNLYRNEDGQFVDVAAASDVEDISAGMSACWGDYNRDGWMDIYVGNMWSSAGKRVAYQRQFQPGADDDLRATFQRHARGNSLFRNGTGDGSSGVFEDVSDEANVTMGRWAWTSKFVDINNDGWEDLVVANGFITQEDNRDL